MQEKQNEYNNPEILNLITNELTELKEKNVHKIRFTEILM